LDKALSEIIEVHKRYGKFSEKQLVKRKYMSRIIYVASCNIHFLNIHSKKDSNYLSRYIVAVALCEVKMVDIYYTSKLCLSLDK
jgi:hypothetical protein